MHVNWIQTTPNNLNQIKLIKKRSFVSKNWGLRYVGANKVFTHLVLATTFFTRITHLDLLLLHKQLKNHLNINLNKPAKNPFLSNLLHPLNSHFRSKNWNRNHWTFQFRKQSRFWRMLLCFFILDYSLWLFRSEFGTNLRRLYLCIVLGIFTLCLWLNSFPFF